MQLHGDNGSHAHLTYCTNIHAGESLTEVMDSLRSHVPPIRHALSPDAPFGLGLRLSAVAAEELLVDGTGGHRLQALSALLQELGCYVFTLNGFPYGPFHGTRVKEEVYLPDWTSSERLDYTNRLAEILAVLLPAGTRGSISTVPGAFKARVSGDETVAAIVDMLIRHVAFLVGIDQRSGADIVLALEPEPCCFLETIDETIAFYRDHLYSDASAARLAALCGLDRAEAARRLRHHLTLCLDLCHAAVEFEDPATCYDRLDAAGVRIGKLQISSGLRLANVDAVALAALQPFRDEVYLHQVVERMADGSLNRYVDLPDAIDALQRSAGEASREWRIHFHVPVFLEELRDFSSTRFFIRDALARQRDKPLSEHLEVETYTWDVLPEAYRADGLTTAIIRELDWVRAELGAGTAR